MQTRIASSILDTIGNTPLAPLRRLADSRHARVLVKVEGANPSGSMKDRMARSMIECAEADGRLRPGDTVVEYTGGSTGVSLALVCAAKGYRLRIVTSDAFSQEKRGHMAVLGAELTLVPSDAGRITSELTREMIEAARKLSREPHTYWTDQLNNRDAEVGFAFIGEEIWTQTAGHVDAFVHVVGTGHSSAAVVKVLRAHEPELEAYAVEPAESPVLSGGAPGAHRIEGIGVGFVPPCWEPGLFNGLLTVSTEEALAMARRLAREEGLFAGTSSGANVVAALRIAQRLGPDATVVTLLCDSGMKYLSTELYRDSSRPGRA